MRLVTSVLGYMAVVIGATIAEKLEGTKYTWVTRFCKVRGDVSHRVAVPMATNHICVALYLC